jgi:hypothetical protein
MRALLEQINNPRFLDTAFVHHPNPKNPPPQFAEHQQLAGKLSQKILDLVVKQIDDVLSLVFESAPSPAGTDASRILQHGDASVMESFISANRLQALAWKIITIGAPPPFHLARLLGLTSALLSHNSELIATHCGFVFQLLYKLEELPVFDFFNTILGRPRTFASAQRWFMAMDFRGILIQRMGELGRTDPWLGACYRLLHPRWQSDAMAEYFGVAVTVVALCQASEGFEDERWETLLALYREQTRDAMRGIWSQAIALLNGTIHFVRPCHVAALKLMAWMLVHDEGIRERLPVAELGEVVTRLFVTYRDHSFLMNAIDCFARAVLHIPGQPAECFARLFVPVALSEAIERRSPTAAAVAYKVLTTVGSVAGKNPPFKKIVCAMPGVRRFLLRTLPPYVALRNADYGGEAQEEPQGERVLCAD